MACFSISLTLDALTPPLGRVCGWNVSRKN